jgi:hypothetical protein
MSGKVEIKGNGIGFFGLLTVLFIGLKLTGYVTWSWFWVLSPLIFSFGLAILILVIAFILYMVSQSKGW